MNYLQATEIFFNYKNIFTPVFHIKIPCLISEFNYENAIKFCKVFKEDGEQKFL